MRRWVQCRRMGKHAAGKAASPFLTGAALIALKRQMMTHSLTLGVQCAAMSAENTPGRSREGIC